jgi:hypothetical protein
MPVTLAVAIRDHKRPPPLRANDGASAAGAAPSALPPPLPSTNSSRAEPRTSTRAPKGAIAHGQDLSEIDVAAAVLKARRATEELEWQAQVKRAKEALTESETLEWNALRARMANVPATTPPRAAPPKKPVLLLARVPAAIEKRAPDNVAPAPAAARGSAREQNVGVEEREAEEREWQELRARARLEEEREWEAVIARARTKTSPQRRAQAHVVAWP